MKALSNELLDKFRSDYDKDAHARTMTAAASKTDIADLAYLPMEAAKLSGPFMIEVKTRGITAQEKSGRCWAYAALNILREVLADTFNVDEFKLSGNYMAFYDKLEKANNMLEMAIENADQPLDSHIMEYLLGGLGDGGHFDMARDLIQKYGICPAQVMPETYASGHTASYRLAVNTLLHKDIAELRRLVKEGKDPQPRKEEMMSDIYKLQCIVFGQPPKTFDLTYKDKDDQYHVLRGLTPQSLYKDYAQGALDSLVSVVSEHAQGKEFGRHYIFHYKGSMAEGNVDFINLPFDQLEELCLTQLKAGRPIWFGCDCEAFENRSEGVWDPESFDFNGVLGNIDLTLSKEDRLDYLDSFANHAMILVGVDLDENGKPSRWKIENSWGEEAGKKGYFVCSEHWFREYVYEAIIDSAYLADDQKALKATKPEVLEPWTSI